MYVFGNGIINYILTGPVLRRVQPSLVWPGLGWSGLVWAGQNSEDTGEEYSRGQRHEEATWGQLWRVNVALLLPGDCMTRRR